MFKNMIVINFDGWNVGLKSSVSSWLEFDKGIDAYEMATHWENWINEET